MEHSLPGTCIETCCIELDGILERAGTCLCVDTCWNRLEHVKKNREGLEQAEKYLHHDQIPG
jgi:hypothetical protein